MTEGFRPSREGGHQPKAKSAAQVKFRRGLDSEPEKENNTKLIPNKKPELSPGVGVQGCLFLVKINK